MAGKSYVYGEAVLEAIFQAVFTAANTDASHQLLANAASSAATNLYVSLHTADPSVSGGDSQLTSEAAYTGYTRVPVARTTGGWTITGSGPYIISNAASITFPQSSSGPETETYFGIGTGTTGNAGFLLYSGQLTSALVVNNGITPSFAIGDLTVEEE